MTPVDLYPVGRSELCGFGTDGTLTLPQSVLDQLGWHTGSRIAIRYLIQPLTLLLWSAPEDRAAFTLGYRTRTRAGVSGGKLVCRRFATQVARKHAHLPLYDLAPAYLNSTPYELAFLMAQPQWSTTAFSLSGLTEIPAEATGVYRLLDAGDRVLRIGEGHLAGRLREHLRHDELMRQARSAQWLALDKADAVILERVLLGLHRSHHKTLPRFNPVMA